MFHGFFYFLFFFFNLVWFERILFGLILCWFMTGNIMVLMVPLVFNLISFFVITKVEKIS